jgi:hypothetical protein
MRPEMVPVATESCPCKRTVDAERRASSNRHCLAADTLRCVVTVERSPSGESMTI